MGIGYRNNYINDEGKQLKIDGYQGLREGETAGWSRAGH